jgi:hypothetical protein
LKPHKKLCDSCREKARKMTDIKRRPLLGECEYWIRYVPKPDTSLAFLGPVNERLKQNGGLYYRRAEYG